MNAVRLSLILLATGCRGPMPTEPVAVPAPVVSPRLDLGVVPDSGPPPLRLPEPPVMAELGVRPAFDDPVLLLARRDWAAGRRSQAAQRLKRWLEAYPEHEERWVAHVLLGIFNRLNGHHKVAAEHFEATQGLEAPLTDFARLSLAQAAERTGDTKRALSWAKRLVESALYGPRARALVARLMMRTKAEGAEAALDAVMADAEGAKLRRLRGQRAQLAERRKDWALAARLHRDNGLRYPKRDLGKAASKRLRQLRWKLPKAEWRALSDPKAPDAILEQARGLLALHRNDQALTLVRQLLTPAETSPIWCDAQWLEARALGKLRQRGDAARAYGRFRAQCPDDSRVIKAAFAQGKALFTANLDDHGLTALAAVAQHPEHPLADDALYISARVHQQAGREAEAVSALKQLLERQPYGDRAAAAHWLLFTLGHSVGTPQMADAAESDRYTVGRMAYFRAREHEKAGRKEAAIDGYHAVIRRLPMGYYALLAANRLFALSPQLLPAALALPGSDSFSPAEASHHPAVVEGAQLLSVGLGYEAWWAFKAAEPDLLRRGGYRRSVLGLYEKAGLGVFAAGIAKRALTHADGRWPSEDRARFEALYPIKYPQYIGRWAKARKVDPPLIYAIIREESRFNRKVESWANACGLMQLTVPTARDLAIADKAGGRMSCRRLKNAYLNIRLGTLFVAKLEARYGTHPGLVVAGYHSGYGNMSRFLGQPTDDFDRWVEGIPFVQTRHYIKRVLTAMWVYRWLLAKKDAPVTDRIPAIPLAFRASAER